MSVTTTEPQPAVSSGAPERRLPHVLAVVVTHNGREWLRDCLVGLNTQTYKDLDVLVVDDASPDYRQPPHLKRIVKRHLRRRRWGFLRTPRPFGFGGAINWALARARTDADMLLFIHDDAQLTPDSVENMVRRMLAESNTAVVGPKIVSWDDPLHLEEVGMAIDRLGYPYKGLEEDEIDIGQHDASGEVFFVTSTCMLVRSDLFRKLKGFDPKMKAFSEDLDLCWRARVLGHSVRFEPDAKARHAMALATGKRKSKFLPQRYYIRRNRLRAVTKNVSWLRLFALIPVFVLVALAEMLGFVILRQPREILNLARALGWNLIRFPQTVAERTRVQLNRQVSDRRLQRLMIRQTSRLRFYMQHQAGRLEEAWGRRAEIVAERSGQARALGSRLKGRPTLIMMGAAIALVLAFRHYLWGEAAAVGELLPYPERTSSLFRAFFTPWHDVGLGQPGATSPAFIVLGFFQALSFGAQSSAQKLLLFGLALASFIGAYRMVSDVTDRWGRVAAGAVYVAGGVGYAGVRTGSLGALAFGALAPFALHSLLRLTGWVRPAQWAPGREIAKLAAAAGISASFVPGSLLLYLVVAIVLALGRQLVTPQSKALRSLVAAVAGLVLAWVLLLPWSAGWWGDGAPLGRLMSDDTWRFYARSFDGHGMTSVLLGQTPDAPALFGVALTLFGLIAAFVGRGQRQRVAVALWSVVVLTGLFVTLFATGTLRPFVSSPVEGGVLASAAFSGLVGIAVGAFRVDLPRRGLGIEHGVAVAGVAAGALLMAAGLGPPVLAGDWRPGGGSTVFEPATVNEVRSLLFAESQVRPGTGYRALWIGDDWTPGAETASRPSGSKIVTGLDGQVLTDLFETSHGEGDAQLDRAVSSIETAATDRGGSLLGAFNIRYIVLQRGPFERGWLQQRDLAAIRTVSDYLLLENTSEPAVAGIYDEVPSYVAALSSDEGSRSRAAQVPPNVTIEQESAPHYVTDDARGPGIAFLPQSEDEGWAAAIEGQRLERTEAGWANGFSVPEDASGSLVLNYERSTTLAIWWIVLGLAWIVVLGAASSTRRLPTAAGTPAGSAS